MPLFEIWSNGRFILLPIGKNLPSLYQIHFIKWKILKDSLRNFFWKLFRERDQWIATFSHFHSKSSGDLQWSAEKQMIGKMAGRTEEQEWVKRMDSEAKGLYLHDRKAPYQVYSPCSEVEDVIFSNGEGINRSNLFRGHKFSFLLADPNVDNGLKNF